MYLLGDTLIMDCTNCTFGDSLYFCSRIIDTSDYVITDRYPGYFLKKSVLYIRSKKRKIPEIEPFLTVSVANFTPKIQIDLSFKRSRYLEDNHLNSM